jgi:hypothetical protein
LIRLGVALIVSTFADCMVRANRQAERWAAAGWAVSGVMIAVSIALTGEAGSPAVMWLALPAVTLGTRFEPRSVLCGVIYLIGLLLLRTLVIDAQSVLDRPDVLIFPTALVIATAIFYGAAQDSDREHRRASRTWTRSPACSTARRCSRASRSSSSSPRTPRWSCWSPISTTSSRSTTSTARRSAMRS